MRNYDVTFNNVEDAGIWARITDINGLDLEDVPLQGAEQACVLETLNNDEDKTEPIRSKRLKIGFNSNDTYNLDTFSQGSDSRYFASLRQGFTPVAYPFKGNLSLADNSEAFQPRPNPVLLTAKDGLNRLKDIELVTTDDELPIGKFTIMEFIVMCLSKIMTDEEIHVVMNLYEDSGYTQRFTFFANGGDTTKIRVTVNPEFFEVGQEYQITDTTLNNFTLTVAAVTTVFNGYEIEFTGASFVSENITATFFRSGYHPFNNIHVDALTFEKGINTREDMYSVMQKILFAFGCFISYDNDGWWIIRWDEYDNENGDASVLRVANFTSTGTFVDYTEVTPDKIIAHDNDDDYEGHFLSNDNAVRRLQRLAKEVAHVYRYEYPREIICNIDFSRGDYVSDLPDETIDDTEYTVKKYDIDCWEKKKQQSGPDGTATNDIYVKKYYVNDYQTSLHLVLGSVGSGFSNFLISQPIEVEIGDKFDINTVRRLSADIGGSGFYRDTAIQVRLYASDGTYYTHSGESSGGTVREWILSDVDFDTGNGSYFYEGDTSSDLTQGESIYGNTESLPIPKSGYLRVLIYQSALWGDIRDTLIDEIRFTYIPKINGSYRILTGQSNAVSQTDDGSKIEQQMYISDSPKKLFKGAMFKLSGSDYILTETWMDYNQTGLGADRLSKWIAYQWWNQFRVNRTIIESDVQGLQSATADKLPTLLNRYQIKHGNETEKYFMLTRYEMDLFLCEMRGCVFVETSTEAGDRTFTDTFEFKYLTDD